MTNDSPLCDRSNDYQTATEALQALHTEIERQKTLQQQLDHLKPKLCSRREVLADLDLNLQQQVRQATRAEDKLQHLRRQANGRTAQASQALQAIHEQLQEAENVRAQARLRAEKNEQEALRVEKEMESQRLANDQVFAELVRSQKTYIIL